MKNTIKCLLIFLILLWSVTWKSPAQESAIYIIKNGRLTPLINTSASSDAYYGRATNAKINFIKIIKDKNGNELK